MYKKGFEKKWSKNIELKNTYYKFVLFESKSYFIKDISRVIMISERPCKRRGDIMEYELDIKENNLNQKDFFDFIDHYLFNDVVKELFKNKELDILNLPQKTNEHLKYRSNGLNIKRANEGDDSKLKNLRVWRDELSRLKHDDLKDFLTEDEYSFITKEIDDLVYNKKLKEEYMRNAFRWCIRGLSVDKVLLKIKNEYKDREYFVKRNAYKKRYNRQYS